MNTPTTHEALATLWQTMCAGWDIPCVDAEELLASGRLNDHQAHQTRAFIALWDATQEPVMDAGQVAGWNFRVSDHRGRCVRMFVPAN